MRSNSKLPAAEFKAMLKTVRRQSRKAGLRKADIAKAIRKVRDSSR
jgi:hypothetical protein